MKVVCIHRLQKYCSGDTHIIETNNIQVTVERDSFIYNMNIFIKSAENLEGLATL